MTSCIYLFDWMCIYTHCRLICSKLYKLCKLYKLYKLYKLWPRSTFCIPLSLWFCPVLGANVLWCLVQMCFGARCKCALVLGANFKMDLQTASELQAHKLKLIEGNFLMIFVNCEKKHNFSCGWKDPPKFCKNSFVRIRAYQRFTCISNTLFCL